MTTGFPLLPTKGGSGSVRACPLAILVADQAAPSLHELIPSLLSIQGPPSHLPEGDLRVHLVHASVILGQLVDLDDLGRQGVGLSGESPAAEILGSSKRFSEGRLRENLERKRGEHARGSPSEKPTCCQVGFSPVGRRLLREADGDVDRKHRNLRPGGEHIDRPMEGARLHISPLFEDDSHPPRLAAIEPRHDPHWLRVVTLWRNRWAAADRGASTPASGEEAALAHAASALPWPGT